MYKVVITMSQRYEIGAIEGVSFESEGAFLLGTIYIGSKEGTKPTAILLHGLPGFEKNVDIAYALREEGWNVLIPHYRGCWGSEGKYTFTGIITDVKNAITMMATLPYVDIDNIFLVGHSLGGWAAMVSAAQDLRVRGVIVIAEGTTLPEASEQVQVHLMNIIEHRFLKGISYQRALQDYKKMGDKLAAQNWIADISPRPILIIGGKKDAVISTQRVQTLYDAAQEPKDLILINEADHVFTQKRHELVEAVTHWLRANMSAPKG
jgi:esterase/lipase